MNWRAVSFDWNQARAFLATAEEGSLSAAARALGQTQPTLGRQVTALEEELGVTLFERVGRSLELTQAGRELMVHVREMRDAAHRVSLTSEGQAQAIDGVIKITASDVFSAYLLPPILARLQQIAPRLRVEVIAANDLRDLQRREADIAIRHVRPEQPELVARRLSEETASLYAASRYLEARGRPKDLADLSNHDFVSFFSAERMMGFMEPIGIKLTPANFRVESENGLVAWDMVRQGLGLGFMADRVAALTPGVEQALPGMDPQTFPTWLTTHRELHTSRRIRLVFDLLAEMLSIRS